MNILVTGSNGFIGRNLVKQLSNRYGYNITCLNRSVCNLLDQDSLKLFLIKEDKVYDIVLHTAIEGGRRSIIDSNNIVYNNILMLYNLLTFQEYFNKIISFGSGAELDRRFDININSKHKYPIDPYGLSKKIINTICISEPKLFNLRIFNCFGIDEEPNRMIRASILRYLHKQDIILHNNKKMDFFYIDDLVTLIHTYIETESMPKVTDCCYNEKYTLLDIANIINYLDNYRVNIVIEKENSSSNSLEYTGGSVYNNNFIGLKNAIKIMYDKYKESILNEKY